MPGLPVLHPLPPAQNSGSAASSRPQSEREVPASRHVQLRSLPVCRARRLRLAPMCHPQELGPVYPTPRRMPMRRRNVHAVRCLRRLHSSWRLASARGSGGRLGSPWSRGSPVRTSRQRLYLASLDTQVAQMLYGMDRKLPRSEARPGKAQYMAQQKVLAIVGPLCEVLALAADPDLGSN